MDQESTNSRVGGISVFGFLKLHYKYIECCKKKYLYTVIQGHPGDLRPQEFAIVGIRFLIFEIVPMSDSKCWPDV